MVLQSFGLLFEKLLPVYLQLSQISSILQFVFTVKANGPGRIALSCRGVVERLQCLCKHFDFFKLLLLPLLKILEISQSHKYEHIDHFVFDYLRS